MNRLIEYIISAKDATAQAVSSAMNRVKNFSSTVSQSMSKAKKDADTGPLEEKFVHTTYVLDKMGLAYERLGVKGQEFNDAMDVLERRLDRVNQTGQGQAELFEHIKASLEDFGASAAQCAKAEEMLKEGLVKVQEEAKASGDSMSASFNPLRALTAALHGNFGSLGREIAKLIPGVKNMGESGTMAIGAFGAALISIIKLVSALKELVSTAFNLGSLGKDIAEASSKMEDMVSASRNFYDTMEQSRETAQKITESLKEQVNATAELTKANNELNRARELAAAKSKEEREAINTKYNRMNAAVDSGASGQLAEIDRQAAKEEGDRLQAELRQAQKDKEEALAAMRKYNRKARLEAPSGVMSSLVSHVGTGFYGGKDSTERTAAWNRAATAASNAYDEAAEKEAEIQKKIEENKAKQSILAIKKKTEEVKNAAREENNVAEDNRKKQEEAAKKAAEYAKQVAKQQKEAEKQERERKRQEEKAAREKEREELKKQREAERAAIKAAREEEKKKHEAKMAELKSERETLNAINKNVSSARSALSAASKRVSEAWGWYKDKDSLKEQIASEEKDIAARRQFAKDMEKLDSGKLGEKFDVAKKLQEKGQYDKLEEQMAKWRKGAFGMSIEDEATMRMALAKEEENAAQKSLDTLVEEAAAQTEHLEAISKAINGEDS